MKKNSNSLKSYCTSSIGENEVTEWTSESLLLVPNTSVQYIESCKQKWGPKKLVGGGQEIGSEIQLHVGPMR